MKNVRSKAKPKLAVVTPLYPSRQGPYDGLAIYQTLVHLKQQAEVEIFYPLAVYPDVAWLKPRSYRAHRLQDGDAPADFPVHYLEYSTVPVVGRPLNGWAIARCLHAALVRFSPELILAYWIYPDGFGALRAGRKLGVPVVGGSRGSDLKRLSDPVTARWTARTIRNANLVLTVSGDLK